MRPSHPLDPVGTAMQVMFAEPEAKNPYIAILDVYRSNMSANTSMTEVTSMSKKWKSRQFNQGFRRRTKPIVYLAINRSLARDSRLQSARYNLPMHLLVLTGAPECTLQSPQEGMQQIRRRAELV